MSLINDALKRATQAQPSTKPAPELESAMEPAPQHRAVGIPGYFTPVLLLIISGSCWFLVQGFNTSQPTSLAKLTSAISPDPIVAQARELGMDLPPDAGSELPVPQNREFALNDAPTPAPPAPVEAAAVATTSEAPVQAEAQPAANFKLQGIFFRPSSPSAVVNARTVFIGDSVGSAKVRAIDERSVTLDVAGETKVLTLR